MKKVAIVLPSPEVSNRYSDLSTGVLFILFFVLSLPALADSGHGGRTFVSGDSVFSDCGTYALQMTGDLNGCLDIVPLRYTCQELEDFALYLEWGEEHFRDDDGVSTFDTKYTLEGIYAPGFCSTFDFTTQLSGSCDHKIFSGRGKFLGANGIIIFNDIIPVSGVSGASNFLYHGYMKATN